MPSANTRNRREDWRELTRNAAKPRETQGGNKEEICVNFTLSPPDMEWTVASRINILKRGSANLVWWFLRNLPPFAAVFVPICRSFVLAAQRPDFKSVKCFSKGEELKFLNFLSDPCYNEITMWQSHCSGDSGAKNDLLAVGTLRIECPEHHNVSERKMGRNSMLSTATVQLEIQKWI